MPNVDRSSYDRAQDVTNFCSNCERLARQLEELEKASTPRLIESAPRDVQFLAWHFAWKHWSTVAWDETRGCWIGEGGNRFYSLHVHFTHWLPLPAPPAPTQQPTNEANEANEKGSEGCTT